MRILGRAVLTGVLALAACGGPSRGLETKQAVQVAVEKHLTTRSNLNLSSLAIEVQEVKFSGQRAEAVVAYRSKQSPEMAVTVRYQLRREGDRWTVETTSPMGAGGHTMSPHGGMGVAPEPSGPTPEQPAAPPKILPRSSK